MRTEFLPRTQPPLPVPRGITPSSSLLASASDGEGPLVWSRSISQTLSESDPEFETGEGSGDPDELDQPSLGYLDDVLGFLAAERAKLEAQREAGVRGNASSQSQASTSESAWRHVVEPRRKRRRKRGKGGTGTTNSVTNHDNDFDGEAEGAMTPMNDAFDGSSSGEHWSYGKSMPSTPPNGTSRSLRRAKGLQPMNVTVPGTSSTFPVHPKLSHSRSTPSLRLGISAPPDARVLRLRTLSTKLRMLFTDDARSLSSVLLNDVPEPDGFIDPRGRPPEGDDPPVHVFIDQ